MGGAVALTDGRLISGRHHRHGRVAVAALALLPLGFLAVFFAWPVAAILGLGFGDDSAPGAGVGQVLGDPQTWRIAAFTVGQAGASTVLAVLAGMPVAYLLARVQLRGLAAVRTLVLVPFVLPTVVVGLAFRALLPDGGVLSIVLANAFFNVAVVARTVSGLWAHTDRRIEDTARALGASRWRAFRSVTLPALAPAVSSAAAVVFLFCATSFGVILMLGGARYRTLETEIYLRTVNLLDLQGAAALSLLQLAAVAGALALGARARRSRERATGLRPRAGTARRPDGPERIVVALAFGVLVLLAVPIGALVIRSVSTPTGWSLAGFRALSGEGSNGALAVSGWEAAAQSVRTATDATALAMIVGVAASVVLVALRRMPDRLSKGLGEALDAALMLPLGVSAVTVGFGYLVTLHLLPGDLRTSPLLVPFAQALVIVPLVVRIVLPVLRAVSERLRQAAATLGASPARVWQQIDLPLTVRPLFAAAGFGYVVALGEFGATSFLARPDAPTLPVAIATLMSRPGAHNAQMAYAACAVLMLVTVLIVLLVDRLSATMGEF